ncbi:peptide-methionine (S)-S-oxide reductase MsrA [uncultured Cohaesibacter sp.]|uniref:peptide-methionine (S)-S-oxide reductase MsrA n=1 Tax=uncultured Cohaesibacter sp. TaxID=1002546 RepID=UPI00292E0680|nr:peptide-methionine (S)-S-oxide reductase MsrA [uncultured Cohaesibacter sp.]
MFGFLKTNRDLPSKENALPGRGAPIPTADRHFVSGRSIHPPFPDGCETLLLGMGCFWGAERIFWQQDGVYVTAVGYSGGETPNPTYQEVCSGRTGHAEVVMVVFDPLKLPLESVLGLFWERHDPTQGMRQGNDIGTQYRSAIYTSSDDQLMAVRASAELYQAALKAKGFGSITSEIAPHKPFYYAEDYHQQYLGKNPNGYCGLGGTGVSCPGS